MVTFAKILKWVATNVPKAIKWVWRNKWRILEWGYAAYEIISSLFG